MTEIDVTGVGGVPASGVAAITVSVMASNAGGGSMRLAPNGDASAGSLAWDSSFSVASGQFTVPVSPAGTIAVEVANATDVTVSVIGWWKTPTSGDTGTGLELLDGPQRLVDTRDGTGTCNTAPCDRLAATTPVAIDVAGEVGLDADVAAVMVSLTVIDPAGAGLVGIGATATTATPIVFDTDTHASVIVPVDPATGTISVGSWTATDVTVDVIGGFTRPTDTYTYEYDSAGLRTAKELEGTWRKEHTWSAGGGLPLLLAEHRGTATSYLVYGPGGTPIYQITAAGQPVYLHQDHQGSTRLTTHANGTIQGAITYDTYGKITNSTIPWLQEQPLATYTGEYTDPETGLIYLRARHYDPTTGNFTTLDPIVHITEEPYGYTGGNPANYTDPLGLGYDVGAHSLPEASDVSDDGGRCYIPPKRNRGRPQETRWGNQKAWKDDAKNIWVWDQDGHAGGHWDVQHNGGKTHTNVAQNGSVIGDRDNFPSKTGKIEPARRSYSDYPMSTLDYLSNQGGSSSQLGQTAGVMAIVTMVVVLVTSPVWLNW